MRGAGWRLDVVETYDARPVAVWPEEVVAALRGGRIDAVLHYSPRSAGAALALIGDSRRPAVAFLPFAGGSRISAGTTRRGQEFSSLLNPTKRR